MAVLPSAMLATPTPEPGKAGCIEDAADAPILDDFGRMVRLVQSNERLFAELRANRTRMAEARFYLARPDANTALGCARLEHLRARHSAILGQLRANRFEAWELLAHCGAVLAEATSLAG